MYEAMTQGAFIGRLRKHFAGHLASEERNRLWVSFFVLIPGISKIQYLKK